MVMTVGRWMGWAAGPPIGTTAVEQFVSISTWYLTSFFPLWTAGLLYNKQRPGNFLRTLLAGHLLLVGNYIAYVAYIAAPPRCPVARRPGSKWTAR